MCSLTCQATPDIPEYLITLLCLCCQGCVCGGAESLSVPAGLADVRRRLGGGLWVVRAAALHPEQRRSDPQHMLGSVRPHGCQVKQCSAQRLGVYAGSQWHPTGSDGVGFCRIAISNLHRRSEWSSPVDFSCVSWIYIIYSVTYLLFSLIACMLRCLMCVYSLFTWLQKELPDVQWNFLCAYPGILTRRPLRGGYSCWLTGSCPTETGHRWVSESHIFH